MRRNRIFYAIYLVVVLYLAMIYYNYGLYVLFYISLVLPVPALIYSLCLRKKIVFAWGRIETVVPRGGEAGIAITAGNQSILPTGVTVVRFAVTDVLMNVTERKKKQMVIGGRGTTAGGLTVRMNHSGRIHVTVESVRVCEPLGLFSHTVKLNLGSVDYTVMPEICEPETSPWEHNPYAYVEEEVYSSVKPGDDPAELFGVREYIPGDKQNRIHWSLTAKQDELMVKQLGLPIDCSALLLLELYRPDANETADVLYDAAFSLSLKLALTGHRHWFSWIDTERRMLCREMIEEEEQVYALIPRVFSCRHTPDDQSVVTSYFAEYPKERFRNIFYVTDKLPEENRAVLKEMRGDAYAVCYVANQNILEIREGEWKEYPVRPGHVGEDLGRNGEVSAE